MSKSFKDSVKHFDYEAECEYALTLRKRQRKLKSTMYKIYTQED